MSNPGVTPNISVSPRSSLIDRKVKICISGLEAGQPVTLHASVVGDANEIFESHAHYVADKEGKVFSLCTHKGPNGGRGEGPSAFDRTDG